MKIKNILIYFIGIIFLLTSIHRIIYKEQRLDEINNTFRLPKYSDIMIILFELIVGILLILNNSYKITILKILLVLLILFSIILLYYNKDEIINTYTDIWTFKPTFTSFILHLTYIIIIISIIYGT